MKDTAICIVCGANIIWFEKLGLPKACDFHTIREVIYAMYAPACPECQSETGHHANYCSMFRPIPNASR
jgi:hypothetical protein